MPVTAALRDNTLRPVAAVRIRNGFCVLAVIEKAGIAGSE
jgi:hypothetical protein